MAGIKYLLSFALLIVWGPFLLYVFFVPQAVPIWARAPGLRRVLMLARDFEPTVFTLLFGLGFSSIVLLGLIKLLTGTLRLPD